MNKIKLALGAVALLIATGGAFASAASHSFATAYYVSGSSCIQVTTDCTQLGNGCTIEVESEEKQLFKSNTPDAGLPCSQALRTGL